MKIAVLGAGGWGLALGLLLDDKGNDVTFWCYEKTEEEEILRYRENKRCLPGIKIPVEVKFTCSMEEALRNAEVVVMAVPSKATRSTSKMISSYIGENAIIVSVAKGIEIDTLKRLDEVINDEVSNPVVILSGPSHAEEVARHMPTTVVVSSTNMEAANKIQEVFMNEYLRVYTNDDVIGVALGGALKNIIALAAGFVEGVGYGDNTKAALITRGIAEISRLGVAMGGNIETFLGLTGIGDLVVTCTSGHSRNRRAGELMGQGYSVEEATKKVNMVVEGIPATKAGYELMKKYNVDMPILTAIYEVLFEGQPVNDTVNKLMIRDKKAEK